MKFKEYVQKANEINHEATGWYRQRAEKIRNEVNQVSLDRDLSGEGRLKKQAQIRQLRGDELLREVQSLRSEYVDLLQKAKSDAEKTLKTAIKKPSDDRVADFERQLKRFKTEIMLTNRFDAVEQKLNGFLSQHITEPYFAQLVADEFPAIISQALAVAENPAKARVQLTEIFDRINNNYLPDEAKAAHDSLAFINASLENPKMFSPIVESNAQDLLGSAVSKAINNPEAYFDNQQ